MRKPGIQVPARSTAEIRRIATQIRLHLGLTQPYVFIENIYEVLPELFPGFSFEVLQKSEMGGDYGRTYPDKKQILLREDVYDSACTGGPRDRFTMAHELGHLFLHTNIKFARGEVEIASVPYRDSEWQADSFASSFLIDDNHLKNCRSIDDVVSTFGVSNAAARCRFK